MSFQRRRQGVPAKIWYSEMQEDNRGNLLEVPVEVPIETKVWIFAQRSGRAEMPGQLPINVIRIGVDFRIGEQIDLWSQVEVLGKRWDVAAPPAYHHGTRHTRHWSVDLRERP